MALDIKDIPWEVDQLPKKQRDFALILTRDGLIEEWPEVFEALDECDLQTAEDERMN